MIANPLAAAFDLAADLVDPPIDSDLEEATQVAANLIDFCACAWPIVDRHQYRSNWHIEAVCDHLQAVSSGEIRQLIINIPPRHMKSLSVAVFWPCWEWLENPATQWLFVSYGAHLSVRDSMKCRRLLLSAGGRRQGGTMLERIGYQGLLRLLGQSWKLTGDQNAKVKFENTETGFRLATSVGGVGTGEGGDIIVIDDPHNANEVESDAKRQDAIEFIDGTLSTRHNDPKTGRTVLVMQRLHEKDATGHLLEQGGWEHLCLPAEYAPKHPFIWPDDPRTEPGELLWPEHFNATALNTLKVKLASRASGQLQQLPSPAEGGILKKAYWRFYDPRLLKDPRQIADFTSVFQSWDTALKEKTTADWTVGQLWGCVGGVRFYLIRQVRGRWGLDESKTQVRAMWQWAAERLPAFAAHSIYVENTANGPDIIAELGAEIPGLTPVDVNRDKISRAWAIEPRLKAGNVLLPGIRDPEGGGADSTHGATPTWVHELIHECAVFPNGANDDQVDATTQALDPSRHQVAKPAAVGHQKAGKSSARPSGAGRDRYSPGSDFG